MPDIDQEPDQEMLDAFFELLDEYQAPDDFMQERLNPKELPRNPFEDDSA